MLRRKEQAMKQLAAFITVIIFSFPCEMSSDAELESVLFESHHFNILNVERVQTRLVNSHIHCSFACLQNALCLSFNAAINADGKGKLICELLSSSLYKDEGNQLVANKHFHHYSSLTKSPCVSWPCNNNGICSPISYRDGVYKCTCHSGYLGRLCETAAPECVNYTVLNETTRRETYGTGPGHSDHTLIQGWYRFQANGYTRMIDSCIPHHKCGGHTTGWLKGGHPSLADGIVERTVCFHGYYNCCWQSCTIRVRDCGEYYVYELRAAPRSTAVYCTT